LLLLCLTGLPLIFHHEIDSWTGASPSVAAAPPGTPLANLETVVAAARRARPGEVPLYISKTLEENHTLTVTMAKSTSSAPRDMHPVIVNEYTAQVLNGTKQGRDLMDIVLDLHTDLCAGAKGSIILAVVALLFIASIISGVVVYGPFTKHLAFGTVRPKMARRVTWLDLHNLLGIVTVAWVLVVGITGCINALDPFIAGLWQSTELRSMIRSYENKPAPKHLTSVQNVLNVALREEPDMTLCTLAFPGTPFAGPHHYGVYLHGKMPITARILKPLLIDAETGTLTDKRDMPFYVKVLFMSQPLHFGDYGGITLKWIWAIFDIATIGVLVSGLWLWRLRGRHAPVSEVAASQTISADFAGSVRL
jgi:uncharacterized iron-regulated membrane protein